MESAAQRWEALYRQSAERIQEMEDRIQRLEQEVQDWKRQAELWKPMCVPSPLGALRGGGVSQGFGQSSRFGAFFRKRGDAA